MSTREVRQEKVNLIFGFIFLFVGLSLGAYLFWAYSVSTRIEGHVSKHEYDEHGCPSLVIEFVHPGGGVREKRTMPDRAHKTPHKQVGEAVPLLVPPGSSYALIAEPDADAFAVGLLLLVGGALTLWSWLDLRAAKKSSTE